MLSVKKPWRVCRGGVRGDVLLTGKLGGHPPPWKIRGTSPPLEKCRAQL